MTDRYFALTVALEEDIREDDAQHIINAIRMIRGVEDVTGEVSDMNNWVAEARVRNEFTSKIFDVLQEKK